MARCATILWSRGAGQVLRMIEFHVKAFFEFVRKGLTRGIFAVHVRVANKAHGRIRRPELCPMAFNTLFVSGKAGPGGVIGAVVAA